MKEMTKKTLLVILLALGCLAVLSAILWGTGYLLYEAFLRP
jgi:hypothetical protein